LALQVGCNAFSLLGTLLGCLVVSFFSGVRSCTSWTQNVLRLTALEGYQLEGGVVFLRLLLSSNGCATS